MLSLFELHTRLSTHRGPRTPWPRGPGSPGRPPTGRGTGGSDPHAAATPQRLRAVSTVIGPSRLVSRLLTVLALLAVLPCKSRRRYGARIANSLSFSCLVAVSLVSVRLSICCTPILHRHYVAHVVARVCASLHYPTHSPGARGELLTRPLRAQSPARRVRDATRDTRQSDSPRWPVQSGTRAPKAGRAVATCIYRLRWPGICCCCLTDASSARCRSRSARPCMPALARAPACAPPDAAMASRTRLSSSAVAASFDARIAARS